MTHDRPKLIEVSLPLEDINAAARAEKAVPRKGSPATLHLWWSRKPLGVSRAVLFSSLVDDPSSRPDRFPTEAAQAAERERLFGLVRSLARWDEGTTAPVLAAARAEVAASTGDRPPAVLDPFCGGGSLPLEGARLGLPVLAGDLNPVAVLMTKALLDAPAPFAGRRPVAGRRREDGPGQGTAPAAPAPEAPFAGLAADLEHYGRRVERLARDRLGGLYPRVARPRDGEVDALPVVSWLWVRTVRCPSPACRRPTPLASQWWLSKRPGRERVYVAPSIEGDVVRFGVATGDGAPESPKAGKGAQFRCVFCGTLAGADHIRGEGSAGRLGLRLMAIQAAASNGRRAGRLFLSPDPAHEEVALACAPPDIHPDAELRGRSGNIRSFGFATHGSLATARQLTALTTFSGIVRDLRGEVLADAVGAGLADDGVPLRSGGCGAAAYADAVVTYLALTLSRMANRTSTMTVHNRSNGSVEQSFVQPGYAFYGDFPEANPFSGSTGSWSSSLEHVVRTVAGLPAATAGVTVARASALDWAPERPVAISTDPPYYDMFDYAALADYFYVWLRRTLGDVWPDVCAPLASPADDQIVSSPARFGGDRDAGRRHFEAMLRRCFEAFRSHQDPDVPLTLFYAYQQRERTPQGGDATAWESMLAALLDAGFAITSTWPLRTERPEGVKSRSNSLASSVVLVCRPRPGSATTATRRELVRSLRARLPAAVRALQQGNIAPVDLAQSAIGPGMAVYSSHARVVDADGTLVTVRDALALINQVLDEVLSEQEGDLDPETRWALAWFEQYGFAEGPYGPAETLSRAKSASLLTVGDTGIAEVGAGRVRLRATPGGASRPRGPGSAGGPEPVWGLTHRAAAALEGAGEPGAAAVLGADVSRAHLVRELAYRLYTISARHRWTGDARRYNALVTAWPGIVRSTAAGSVDGDG